MENVGRNQSKQLKKDDMPIQQRTCALDCSKLLFGLVKPLTIQKCFAKHGLMHMLMLMVWMRKLRRRHANWTYHSFTHDFLWILCIGWMMWNCTWQWCRKWKSTFDHFPSRRMEQGIWVIILFQQLPWMMYQLDSRSRTRLLRDSERTK